ncbi:MAG: DUF2247 domain-containing protein [Pseudomonas sp.]|nr:DUF2247 family protein [Pseudomonas sp.]MBA4242453.1 DUF2247 domain-containing protein [Pseudomonas sp.]
MNEYFPELAKRNLVDWPTLAIALNNGWINKDAVSEHAFRLLSASQQNSDIAVLAGSDALSDDEVVALLATLCKKEGIDLQEKRSHVLEKWRLAMLSELQHSSLADEDKIERLQALYAEFDYPDDMASCSIYAQNDVDPIDALHQVVTALEQRFASGR